MITPTTNTAPLDFDVSLSDFFSGFLRHNQCLHSKTISYEARNILTLHEPIGISLTASDLIFYPALSKQLRKLNQLNYHCSLDLNSIESFSQNGLKAMRDSLSYIENALYQARTEKASLDAHINNLIFLYGQEKKTPLFHGAKSYYCRRSRTFGCLKATTLQINISGVNYLLRYHGNRFKELKTLHVLDEHQLLSNYFTHTQKEPDALSRNYKINFLGGIINTPIFIFRARYNFNQKGRKYYIDLADNRTYTRLSDVQQKARLYTINYHMMFIKE